MVRSLVPASSVSAPPWLSITVSVSLAVPTVRPLSAVMLTSSPAEFCTMRKTVTSSVSCTSIKPLASRSRESASTVPVIPPDSATRVMSSASSVLLVIVMAPEEVMLTSPETITSWPTVTSPCAVTARLPALVPVTISRLVALLIWTAAVPTWRFREPTSRLVRVKSVVAVTARLLAVIFPPTVRTPSTSRVTLFVPTFRSVPSVRSPPTAKSTSTSWLGMMPRLSTFRFPVTASCNGAFGTLGATMT